MSFLLRVLPGQGPVGKIWQVGQVGQIWQVGQMECWRGDVGQAGNQGLDRVPEPCHGHIALLWRL